MKRRRFLGIAACFAATPLCALTNRWQGQALGGLVSVTLRGPRTESQAALSELPKILEQIENSFSLYRPSELTQLNASGQIRASTRFLALLQDCQKAWKLTDGLFDPTVQPLWHALAKGTNPQRAHSLIGWDRVTYGPDNRVRLAPGQELTLNGIAQGFATDAIADTLLKRGFDDCLINMGEHRALGGPHRLALVDPLHGNVGQRSLNNTAIATSSPSALTLGNAPHILSPQGHAPRWSTISIETPSATLADALSTAAVFMDEPRLGRLKKAAGLSRITTLDQAGNLRSL